MTIAEFEKLRKIDFFRVSSYEIQFSQVVTKLENERKRRGCYYFQTVLRHESEDQERVQKLNCRLIFNPYKPEFHIESMFVTDAADPNEALTDYLKSKPRLERNSVNEEDKINAGKLAGMRVLCAIALNNLNSSTISGWELTKHGVAKYELEEGRVQLYPQGYH